MKAPSRLVILAALLFHSLAVFAAPADETKPPAIVAYINAFQGAVTVVSANKSIVKPQVGMPLRLGDQIVTAAGANAELYIPEAGIVSVGADSQLQMAQGLIVANTSGTILRLMRGAMRGVFETLRAPLGVATGTYIAGIRGTRFITDASASAPQFAVLEGHVEISQSAGSRGADLYSGEYTPLKGAAPQGKPLPLEELGRIDRNFDFPINAEQSPYVYTHQRWAALITRNLQYDMPRGWSAYPPSVYLDLLSPQADTDLAPSSFIRKQEQGKLKLDSDKQGRQVLQADGGSVTVTYQIAVPVDGDYRLEAAMVGGQQYWTVEGVPTQLSQPGYAAENKPVGPFHLNRGVHELTVSIPAGGKLAGGIQLRGPQFAGYAPEAGWSKDKLLRYGDMASSLAKVLGIKATELDKSAQYQQWREALQKRGFLLRERDAVVLGSDALVNAALLRGKPRAPEAQQQQRRRQTEKEDPEAIRAPVSPVVPVYAE